MYFPLDENGDYDSDDNNDHSKDDSFDDHQPLTPTGEQGVYKSMDLVYRCTSITMSCIMST